MNQVFLALLTLYLLILPFDQLIRLATPYPDITIHITDIIVGIILVIWISNLILNKKREKHTTKPHKHITIFIFIALISLLKGITTHPLQETLIASFYLIRWIAYASLFPVTLKLMGKNKFRIQIIKTLILIFILIPALGLIQYFFFPDLKFLSTQGWDDHYYRLVGSFLDPGFTGIILIIGLIFFSSQKKIKIPKHINYLLLSIIYINIALTYSRASYLALTTIGIIFIWTKKSIKLLIFSATIILLTWTTLPRPPGEGGNLTRTSTIKYRITNYQQAFQITRNNPLLGIGFNRLRYTKRNYEFLPSTKILTSHSASGIDNSFLFILTTTGIFGFIFYTWMWIAILKSTWPNSKTSNHIISKLPITLMFIAILIHAQFHNTLFYPPVMALIWIFLAISQKQITYEE